MFWRLEAIAKVISTLAHRLDYSHGTEWEWHKLIEFLRLAESSGETASPELAAIWQHRKSWWPEYHLSQPSPAADENRGSVISVSG